MSVAEAANRPASTGRAVKLWLGLIVLIAAGIGLAWYGAGSLRPEVTQTGLEFRVIKEGTGDPIRREDVAGMQYVLTSDDGTVLDSSDRQGGAQPFTMDGVYVGFAEAMAKMKEGGRYHFRFPESLAAAPGQPPQDFPGDHLTFDVQVQKVIRGGAMMMQRMQAQQAQQGQQGGAEPPQQ